MKRVALFAASLLVSLVVADLLFRLYEDRFLTLDLSSVGPEVDLAALNFNEARVAKRKAAGQFRILSFGDSFAYGIVKRAHTYHSVAGEILGARVVNLGEPAIAIHRYLRAYDYWAETLEHDAVVFNLYLGNDLQESDRNFVAEDEALNPLFAAFDYNLETGRKRELNLPSKFPLRMLDYAYAGWLSTQIAASKIPDSRSEEAEARGPYNLALVLHDEAWILEYNAARLDLYRPAEIGRWQGGFEAMIAFAEKISALRQGGKQVLVLLSPTALQTTPAIRSGVEALRGIDLDDYDLDLPSFLTQEIFRRVDPAIPVLDLRPTLQCAAEEGQVVYHPRNSHWSLEGNQIVGERLARFASGHWLERGSEGVPWQRCAALDSEREVAVEATSSRKEVAARVLNPLFDSR